MTDQEILKHHLEQYPNMTAQDVYKLCYQSAFGAGHILTDPDRAMHALFEEWEVTEPCEEALITPILNRRHRISISAWKREGMPKQWLWQLFFASTNADLPSDSERFAKLLLMAGEVIEREKALLFDAWNAYLSSLDGYPSVHHSESYRKAYAPAYRVIGKRQADLIPILRRTWQLIQAGKSPITVAIDGRCASGKSTAAETLSRVLGTGVIRMDDFFLPPDLKAPDRLSKIGGNVHYERFAKEVLPNLKSTRSFSYGMFDCSQRRIHEKREVGCDGVWLVEGSYSHHPNFDDYADLRVFFTISPEEQMQRIVKRNGEKMAQRFQDEWIPMEESYFTGFQMMEKADLIVATDQD